MRRTVSIATLALMISACYAEGNSEFLSAGETRYFFTMSACEQEATSTYAEGGSIYAGFECRKKLAWFLIETRSYYSGQRER